MQHSNIFAVEVSGVNDKAMEKTIKVIGGVGQMWGDKQFRQKARVIDKRKCAYAVNASAIPSLVVRKCRKNVY